MVGWMISKINRSRTRIMLSEAILSPDVKNAIIDSAKSDPYSSCIIYLTSNGTIQLEEPPRNETKAEVTLFFSMNTIQLRGERYANKISSGAQQLITSLYKTGLIDSTWKLTKHERLSYHTAGGKYITDFGHHNDLSLLFWMDRKNRLFLGNDLTFYHGTSTFDLPLIKKQGLLNLSVKGISGGTATRLKIEENRKFVYLSTDIETAMSYAKERAGGYNRKYHADAWSYMQYQTWQVWDIQPVILKVTLPDVTKLRSDDDRLIKMIKAKAYEVWQTLPANIKSDQIAKTVQWFKTHNMDYKPEQIETFLWVMSDPGFEYILPMIDKSEWNNWKRSLEQDKQVAYEGIIPPKFLSVVSLPK
jgi:hypothetical protein